MKDFSGKVAVITGAAEGIGKAIAQRAAAEGMRLVLADIAADALAATTQQLIDAGAEAIAVPTNVSRAEEVERLAEKAYERYGQVHLLVNNAGVGLAKPLWEVSATDWDWIVGVNLYGVTHGIRSFVPCMLSSGEEGHIVNTASVAGLLSHPGLGAYNATKHAVVTLSESLHHDLVLRKSRLGVSVLCPAWVKTRIAASERNRDEADATRLSDLDPIAQRVAGDVFRAVDQGISPEIVADEVFAAVAQQRFYILTHPEIKQAVQVRMDDILQQRAPTLLKF